MGLVMGREVKRRALVADVSILLLFSLGLTGCAETLEPAFTVSLALPVVSEAVGVSSARFLGPSLDRVLSNSELRNCRFGRTDKIDLMPVVIEWTDTELRFLSASVMPLEQGALPEDLSGLQARMTAVANNSRSLAQGGCHPWRGSPEDLSMVPALLIAADAGQSAQGLARLSQLAAESGLLHQAVWVSAEQQKPMQEETAPVSELALLPVGDSTVSGAAEAAAQLRAQGRPCIQLSLQSEAQQFPSSVVAPAMQHAMRGRLPVVPLFWPAAGAERMVSGERCMAPATSQTVVVPEEASAQ